MKQLVDAESVEVRGNAIIRSFKIKAGSELVTHKHPYDHASFLLSGEVQLKAGDTVSHLVAPRMVEIKAGIEHGIYAVTDCEWECRHLLSLAKQAAENGDPYVMQGVK